jgi:hypothetical protein
MNKGKGKRCRDNYLAFIIEVVVIEVNSVSEGCFVGFAFFCLSLR